MPYRSCSRGRSSKQSRRPIAIRAVVFTGAGGRFSFGADIKDFATDPTPETKTVHDALAAVERSFEDLCWG
jgi:enoyl-CoA hydratase/carnithine racemase